MLVFWEIASLEELSAGKLLDISGVRVAHGDAAHVHASFDLEETFVSPAGSPRILDNPVFHSCTVCAVADSEDSVVHILLGVTAGSGGVDAAGVGREVIDDLEANGCWAVVVDSVLEFFFVIGGNVDSTGDHINDVVACLDGAVAVFGVVRVALLASEATIVHDVLKGLGWETAVASVVLKGAGTVNELLLRVGGKGSILDEVGRF